MNSMSPPSSQYNRTMRIDDPFFSASPTMFLTIFLPLIGWWNLIFIISIYVHTFVQVFHSIKDHHHYYGTNYDLNGMRQSNQRISEYTRMNEIHTDASSS